MNKVISMPNTRTLLLASAAFLATPAMGAQPLGCLIEPEQVADIGSQVVGVIETVNVQRGDVVRKGDVIATLVSNVERASVDVARARAQSSADIRVAEANLDFSRQQHARAGDLFKQKFIANQALDEARTGEHVAERKLTLARDQKAIAQRELALAEAQLALRVIRSPIDGIVAERYMHAGERIEEKPLLRIASINPLRVEVVAPLELFGKIKTGETALIAPDLPGTEPLTAQVDRIDKLIDPASNTFRVRLTLPNPDGRLPAGLRCTADFDAGKSSTKVNPATPAPTVTAPLTAPQAKGSS